MHSLKRVIIKILEANLLSTTCPAAVRSSTYASRRYGSFSTASTSFEIWDSSPMCYMKSFVIVIASTAVRARANEIAKVLSMIVLSYVFKFKVFY